MSVLQPSLSHKVFLDHEEALVFLAQQLQEKCIEQQVALYQAFVDLTKAFDTVN